MNEREQSSRPEAVRRPGATGGHPKPRGKGLSAIWAILAAKFAWRAGTSVAKSAFNILPNPPVSHAALSPEKPQTKIAGRETDRILEPQNDASARERWGTMLVASALIVSLAGGIAFLIAYWTFSGALLLGGTLAVFLGGLGVALVWHAHWLMIEEQAVEPREHLASPPDEREAADANFREGAHEIRRRGLLKTMGLAAGAIISGIAVSLFRSLGSRPEPSLYSTIWKRGQRLITSDGKPVSVNTLEPGSTIIVFPEGEIDAERAQTVLIRVHEGMFRMPRSRASWVPQGYVAYSRVCTHAGCPVGLYEATTQLLMCPCHQSTFDVLRAALPTGGPAARALPQLPLYVDSDGTLRAAGGFSAPPGPGFWSMPS